MDVELRLLRTFVAVAEELNFTRAAARLHLDQPALSRQIQQLERRLGVRLLDRSTRHVALTPAGDVLAAHAPVVLTAAASAVTATRRAGGAVGGTLAIAYAYNTNTATADILDGFRQQHPGVRVTTWVGVHADVLSEVDAEDTDAAVVWHSLPEPGWQTRRLRRHDVVCVLPREHPLTRGRRVLRSALTGEPIVLFDRSIAPAAYDLFLRELHPGDPSPPVVAAEILSAGQEEMMAEALRRGLPTLAIREVATRYRLPGTVHRPISPPLRIDTVLAWRRQTNPALAALLAYLAEEAPAGA